MAAGDLTTQSLSASTDNYQPGFLARAISTVVGKVFYSAITNRKPAAMAAARRSAVAAADSPATSLSTYSASAVDAGQSMHVDVSCRFSAASQSCTLFLALFDGAGTLMGTTSDIIFTGDASYTDGSKYPAAATLVDIRGASSYYPIVRVAPASGSVDIYAENL